MAGQWEVLMETVPQKQRVLFALPVGTSPDRDYTCPAVETLRRQLPQGGAVAPMDGPQLVKMLCSTSAIISSMTSDERMAPLPMHIENRAAAALATSGEDGV